ncbi:anti-sigma factor [Amphibiibacter pelophylacis]|uniref:Anti-sigma factor n=1 Tax=Amphibiibacter pelophylacis TaxID=1799477 RepID=A0ACC6NYH2_9BURK
MKYDNPDLIQALAARYVTGTLRGAARQRWADLLRQRSDIAQTVAEWQRRLQPLSDSLTPVAPPARVWRRIEARLEGESASASAATPLVRAADSVRQGWQRLWVGALGGMMAAGLAALLVWPAGPQQGAGGDRLAAASPPQVVAVIGSENRDQVLVASIDSQQHELWITPMQVSAQVREQLAQSRSLELWAIGASGQPRSLGLIHAQELTRVPLGTAQQLDLNILAVSLEPAGGSPTGQPTGPVLYTGEWHRPATQPADAKAPRSS